MSDDYAVKASPPILTEAHLSPRRVKTLFFPHLHLCAETKNSDDASGASSTATTTTRESTATSFTTINAYSRCSSTEPTESPTSSTARPSSSSALDPPRSPVRVPARLRRKCPMYAQREGREDHGDASAAAAAAGKNIFGTAKIEPIVTADQGAPPSTARVTGSPVVVMAASPKRKTAKHAAPRQRILPPEPVPHLIKKSRGRRVPEPDEARERAHICAVPGCSKSFARAEHLKRHVISLHTHEKPFSCGCGKTFARRDNLLQHQRVHTT